MDISIIIPCYNPGKYLLEAVESVYASEGLNQISYEIIIINDGSTDKYTLLILEALKSRENLKIIHQINKGLATARNVGIDASAGDCLLFLDADNRIRSRFIKVALSYLRTGKADVVHGNPYFFGDSSEPRFRTGPFEMNSMLLTNYIDACAAIRRIVWEALGGFDDNKLVSGFEDWDFWLRAGKAGFKFQYVNETLYDYRIVNTSMITTKNTGENLDKAYSYVLGKHPMHVGRALRALYFDHKEYKEFQAKPFQGLMTLAFKQSKQQVKYQLYRVRNVLNRIRK